MFQVVIFMWLGVIGGKKAGIKSVDSMSDLKEFKKLLKTRTSVLACFTKNSKESSKLIKTLSEVADIVRGSGTIVTVDCGGYSFTHFYFT